MWLSALVWVLELENTFIYFIIIMSYNATIWLVALYNILVLFKVYWHILERDPKLEVVSICRIYVYGYLYMYISSPPHSFCRSITPYWIRLKKISEMEFIYLIQCDCSYTFIYLQKMYSLSGLFGDFNLRDLVSWANV